MTAVEDLKVQLLTREDVLELLGISHVTLWKWVKSGIIREHKMQRHIYYLKDELMEDIKKL